MTDTNNTGTNLETSDSRSSDSSSMETLVVVSKIKKYIRECSGMNTSKCCVEALSHLVSETCKQAIENAKTSGRKTVMGRDIGSH